MKNKLRTFYLVAVFKRILGSKAEANFPKNFFYYLKAVSNIFKLFPISQSCFHFCQAVYNIIKLSTMFPVAGLKPSQTYYRSANAKT